MLSEIEHRGRVRGLEKRLLAAFVFGVEVAHPRNRGLAKRDVLVKSRNENRLEAAHASAGNCDVFAVPFGEGLGVFDCAEVAENHEFEVVVFGVLFGVKPETRKLYLLLLVVFVALPKLVAVARHRKHNAAVPVRRIDSAYSVAVDIYPKRKRFRLRIFGNRQVRLGGLAQRSRL